MKNFMKVCLIAGGVCILIGGGITTVAAAMGGRLSDLPSWNYRWLGRDIVGDITGDLRSEMDDLGRDLSDQFDDSFDELDREFDEIGRRHDGVNDGELNESEFSGIYARKLDLEVRRGKAFITYDAPADKIVVSSGEDMSRWNVYSEEDELKVTVGSKSWDSYDYEDTVVYIHVPVDYRFEEVELKVKAQRNNRVINSDNGPAITAEALKADKIEIDAAVGAVSVTGADAGKLEVDSDVGAVKFEGNVDGDVDAECSVGAVKLDLAGEKADFNYEIKCRVGSITVDGEGFSGLSKERKINNGAAKKMELDCSTGAIEVKFH